MGVGAAKGSARAKLLLLGEHAAVYGHPAVGVALDWDLTVVQTLAPRWEFPNLGPYEGAVRRLVEWFVDQAGAQRLPVPSPGRLEFTTEIPVACGFGSSGALCACLVNLFFPTLPLPNRDRLAWLAEGLFHGTPSGIDTSLALRDGWWALDPSTRPVSARRLSDPGLVLVVGAVTRESDTLALVSALAACRKAGDPGVASALDTLGGLAAQAIAQWNAGRRQDLADLVNRARTELRVLGLETPALTAALNSGLGCPGALAGKLSGAGGGGAFFLMFLDRASALQALPVIEASVAPGLWASRPRLL